MMALEHARVGRQRLRSRGSSPAVLGHRVADGDEGGDREAGLGPVEPGVVAQDEPASSSRLTRSMTAGRREADLVGDGLVAGAAVGGEELEDAARDAQPNQWAPGGDGQLLVGLGDTVTVTVAVAVAVGVGVEGVGVGVAVGVPKKWQK